MMIRCRVFGDSPANSAWVGFALNINCMETYKTVVGTENLNGYIELGWKRLHVFTKQVAWTDKGEPSDCDAAFVIVWDLPEPPRLPENPLGDDDGPNPQ